MLKFTNNTNNKIWIGNYCFVPGESFVGEFTEEEAKQMKASMSHKDWKEALEKKVIEIDYDYKEEVKKTK